MQGLLYIQIKNSFTRSSCTNTYKTSDYFQRNGLRLYSYLPYLNTSHNKIKTIKQTIQWFILHHQLKCKIKSQTTLDEKISYVNTI